MSKGIILGHLNKKLFRK